MTIRQLIAILSEHDLNLRVMVDGYEGGLSDIKELKVIKCRLDVNKEWYFGNHEEAEDDQMFDCEALRII